MHSIEDYLLSLIMLLKKIKKFIFGEPKRGEKIKKPSFRTTLPQSTMEYNDWSLYISTTLKKINKPYEYFE